MNMQENAVISEYLDSEIDELELGISLAFDRLSNNELDHNTIDAEIERMEIIRDYLKWTKIRHDSERSRI